METEFKLLERKPVEYIVERTKFGPRERLVVLCSPENARRMKRQRVLKAACSIGILIGILCLILTMNSCAVHFPPHRGGNINGINVWWYFFFFFGPIFIMIFLGAARGDASKKLKGIEDACIIKRYPHLSANTREAEASNVFFRELR